MRFKKHKPAPPSAPLELVSPASAAVEKDVQSTLKSIRFALDGNRRAGNLFFAYAALAGSRANHLSEILPHGSLEKTLEQHFPADHETIRRWRKFADALIPQLKTDAAALLNAPVIGKNKSLPAKKIEGLQEVVREVLDGAGMVEFTRACKFLKEEQEVGGYHVNPKQFQTFLKETDPPKYHKYLGKTYEECPPVVRAAFRQSITPAPETASSQADSADAALADQIQYLTNLCDPSGLHHYDECSRAKLKQLEEARLTFGRILATALEKRK